MLSILIVDDEVNICKLIKNLINWDSMNLSLIGCAYNGNSAYEIIKEQKPDIVITDIRMPGMTGLELIQKCKDDEIDSRFIILSGYTQFDYAYTAIKYGVSDFLLKPINKTELNSTLLRTVESLDASMIIDDDLEGIKERKTNLKKTFLLHLIHKDMDNISLKVDNLNTNLGFNFEKALFQIGIVTIDYSSSITEIHADSILLKLKESFVSEIEHLCYDYSISSRENKFYFILNYSANKTNDIKLALQYAFDNIQSIISPYGFLYASMGVGSSTKNLKDIENSYNEAYYAVQSRLVLGKNEIIDGVTLDLKYSDTSLIEVKEPNNLYTANIRSLDKDALAKDVEKEFYKQMPPIDRYPYSIYDYSIKFATALINDINRVHPFQQGLALLNKNIKSSIKSCTSIDEILEYIILNAELLITELKASSSSDLKIINTSKKYIDKHYNEKIELEDIAHKVYLSPAYLGILFKKETGVNFSDYLINIRIQKAKDFLKETHLNINEIAASVGYKDVRYFSRLFKKHVGVLPTEYRKLSQTALR